MSAFGITISTETSDECRCEELCEQLLSDCAGQRLGDVTAALIEALMTVITSAAQDRAQAERVLGRVVAAMRDHIDSTRPVSH
jgi:hypothetical protein